MATSATVEREHLCDLLHTVGPDAPTLCGDWTTRDLAAHLVTRERRPDATAGMLARPLTAHSEKVQLAEARRDFGELVRRLRSGPPAWSPTRLAAVDRLANTIEFFVHHEDVRRAGGDWDVRQLGDTLTSDLERLLRRGAKLLARRSPEALALQPDSFPPIVARDGAPMVTASGPIGELVLFVLGRQAHSRVSLDGPAAAVDAVQRAPFGI